MQNATEQRSSGNIDDTLETGDIDDSWLAYESFGESCRLCRAVDMLAELSGKLIDVSRQIQEEKAQKRRQALGYNPGDKVRIISGKVGVVKKSTPRPR